MIWKLYHYLKNILHFKGTWNIWLDEVCYFQSTGRVEENLLRESAEMGVRDFHHWPGQEKSPSLAHWPLVKQHFHTSIKKTCNTFVPWTVKNSELNPPNLIHATLGKRWQFTPLLACNYFQQEVGFHGNILGSSLNSPNIYNKSQQMIDSSFFIIIVRR